MAATVQIVEKNGAGGTTTDKTSGTIRFKNADNSTVDTGNPMVKPGAGVDYSFEKWLRLNVTGGTYTEITNVKAYMDGANGLGTGITLYAKAVASYVTPAEATATTGYTDAFTYTSGAPLSLGAGPFSVTVQVDTWPSESVSVAGLQTTVATGKASSVLVMVATCSPSGGISPVGCVTTGLAHLYPTGADGNKPSSTAHWLPA